MTDLCDMHMAILNDVREKIAEKQAELERLLAVEQYHNDAIVEMAHAEMANRGDAGAEATPPRRIVGLSNRTKHDAAAIALKELGGRAKTGDIADWLQAHGYQANREKQAFYNGIYTALKRQNEMFRKVGTAEWELIEGRNGKRPDG